MKKNIVIGMLCLVLTACDGRKEELKTFNKTPEIGFRLVDNYRDTIVGVLRDSLKLSPLGEELQQSHVPLIVTYSDGNKNASKILTSFSSPAAILLYRQDTIKDQLPMSNIVGSDIPIRFSTLESNKLSVVNFEIIDALNAKAQARLEVYSFTNLAPVAHLSVRKTGLSSSREYEFDGSKSYDQDERFGGEIQTYVFYLNESELYRGPAHSRVKVIPVSGTYTIGLKAIDNEGMESAIVREEITVN